MEKTLSNTTANQAKDNVKDIIFWGDGDAWKLLGKASSQNEGWMKSSKAYEIEDVGCIVQVTTQQNNKTSIRIPKQKEDGTWVDFKDQEIVHTSAVAEAVTFVPNVKIEEVKNKEGVVTSRKLVKI